MSLDDDIISRFCLIDAALLPLTSGKRLRQDGPQPKMSDNEVITIEVGGISLGLTRDKALFEHFRRHSRPVFPALIELPPVWKHHAPLTHHS